MPETTPRLLAAKSFCAALNHLLARERWAREQLLPYAGKTAHLAFASFAIGLQVDPEGMVQAWPPSAAPESAGIAPEPAGTAPYGAAPEPVTENAAAPRYDVSIVASPQAAAAFVQGGQAAAMKHVKIVGDAEFASTIARLAEHLRWEPEEDLAQLIGDAPAHRLAGHVRDTWAQARRSGQSLLESLAEYFLDENPQLVRRAALDQMRDELVSLRDAVARLEKRVDRVARQAPAAVAPASAAAMAPAAAAHARPTQLDNSDTARGATDAKSSDRPG